MFLCRQKQNSSYLAICDCSKAFLDFLDCLFKDVCITSNFGRQRQYMLAFGYYKRSGFPKLRISLYLPHTLVLSGLLWTACWSWGLGNWHESEIWLLPVLWLSKSFVYDPVLCFLPAFMKLWQGSLDYWMVKITLYGYWQSWWPRGNVKEQGWGPYRPIKRFWGNPRELVLNMLTKCYYQSGIKYFCNFLLQAEY